MKCRVPKTVCNCQVLNMAFYIVCSTMQSYRYRHNARESYLCQRVNWATHSSAKVGGRKFAEPWFLNEYWCNDTHKVINIAITESVLARFLWSWLLALNSLACGQYVLYNSSDGSLHYPTVKNGKLTCTNERVKSVVSRLSLLGDSWLWTRVCTRRRVV